MTTTRTPKTAARDERRAGLLADLRDAIGRTDAMLRAAARKAGEAAGAGADQRLFAVEALAETAQEELEEVRRLAGELNEGG